VHEGYVLGLRLRVGLPRNGFALHEDSRPAVLIAGGIGITPLKAMAQALRAEGRAFHLHYTARSRSHMAYRTKLELALDGALTLYPGDEGRRIDSEALLSEAPAEAVFYVCGPERLTAAVRGAAAALGVDDERLRFERFTPAVPEAGDSAFELRLARSGTALTVAPDQTILDSLLDAGVEAEYGCRSGTCGTCAVKLLDGAPLHRDSALTRAERDQAGLLCVCVSRAAGDSLVLDL
jgi:ferredoxin-NADP reductase